ncbi:MAG: nitroreductase family protein [Deltaproteobacteria bacterium]|uniref:Nitroreductase family protein n=1 Tax=Candidatus Zymogenus saltonus TaxID=2844893 RepID=A0A9D8KHF8_9DELT|nr:nitroreductase family protein [Candidatus Zymogenus saltonus]
MIVGDLVKNICEPSSFTDKGIEDDILMKVLEAARLAPSANNSQVWRFFVVKDRRVLKALFGLSKKASFDSAPVIIAAFAEPWTVARRGREQPFFMIDVPIDLSHIILMAKELGISASIEFEFDETRVVELLNPPKNYRAVALVALGYAADFLPRKKVDLEGMIRDG